MDQTETKLCTVLRISELNKRYAVLVSLTNRVDHKHPSALRNHFTIVCSCWIPFEMTFQGSKIPVTTKVLAAVPPTVSCAAVLGFVAKLSRTPKSPGRSSAIVKRSNKLKQSCSLIRLEKGRYLLAVRSIQMMHCSKPVGFEQAC